MRCRKTFRLSASTCRVPISKIVVAVAVIGDSAAELAKSARIKRERVFLGGRSMGGRMCSIAVAEGLPAAGLVLISYPLHPPGKPDTLRVDHFKNISVPCLFVSGTSDAFGTPAEIKKHVRRSRQMSRSILSTAPIMACVRAKAEMVELVVDWVGGCAY